MLKFTILGKPVPYVRMTQKTKWYDNAQRYLAYQEFVRVSFTLAFKKLPRKLQKELINALYYRVNVYVYLKSVLCKDYICSCGRAWKTQKTENIICPQCRESQPLRYALPAVRGDADNYLKSIIDGIFGGKSSLLGNDKQVIDKSVSIHGTQGDERVEAMLCPSELLFDEQMKLLRRRYGN